MGNVNYNGADLSSIGGSSVMPNSTGDIVLTPDKPKTSLKRIIVIVSSVLIALMIVVIIALIIINNQSKNESLYNKFNKLINFVVSGEESTAPYSQPYDNNATYYFNEQQKNITNREPLYAKTDALMTNFLNSYNSSPSKSSFTSNPEEFEKIMEDEQKILQFASSVRLKSIPNIYDIIKLIQNDGEKAAKESLINYFNAPNLNNNHYYTDFIELYKNYITQELNTAKSLTDKNCISGTTINTLCLQNLRNDNSITYNAIVSDMNNCYSPSQYFTENLLSTTKLLNNTSNAYYIKWRGSNA